MRIARYLLTLHLRGLFKATDPVAARRTFLYFALMSGLVFGALGLGNVPAEAQRIYQESGPGGLTALLNLFVLGSGAATFASSCLALTSEARYNRTLETLALLRVPLRRARAPLFGILLAFPVVLASYLSLVFFLYLAAPGAVPLGRAALASLGVLLFLVATSALGLLVFAPMAAQGIRGFFNASVAAAGLLLIPLLVVFLRFPSLVPVDARGEWAAGGGAASAALSHPGVAVPGALAGAAAILGLAFLVFTRSWQDAASLPPTSPRGAPRVSMARALAALGRGGTPLLLLGKELVLLARNPGQSGVVAFSALVLALIPAGVRWMAPAQYGAPTAFVLFAYFGGIGLYVLGLSLTEIFVSEGPRLHLYRQSRRLCTAAAGAKTAAAILVVLLAAAVVTPVYAVLLPEYRLGVLAFCVFYALSAGLGCAVAAMRFGEYTVHPGRVSLPGRSAYLAAAVAVSTGGAGTALLVLVAGGRAVALVLLLAAGCTLGLSGLWLRSCRDLAVTDL